MIDLSRGSAGPKKELVVVVTPFSEFGVYVGGGSSSNILSSHFFSSHCFTFPDAVTTL